LPTPDSEVDATRSGSQASKAGLKMEIYEGRRRRRKSGVSKWRT